MTSRLLADQAPSNSAPATPYKTYDITPTEGEGPILLHGRLLSYAQFTVPYMTSSKPIASKSEQLRYIRQELYISSDEQYLAVETVTHGDASGYQRECACWSYPSAAKVMPPFRYPQYRGAMLLQAGIDWPWIIDDKTTRPYRPHKVLDTLKLWCHTVEKALRALEQPTDQVNLERAIVEVEELYHDYCAHCRLDTQSDPLIEQRLARITQHSLLERRNTLIEGHSMMPFIMDHLPNTIILPASTSGFTHVIFQGRLLSQCTHQGRNYQLYQLMGENDEQRSWVGHQQQGSQSQSVVEHLEFPQDIYQFFGADIAFTLTRQLERSQRPFLCFGSKESKHG